MLIIEAMKVINPIKAAEGRHRDADLGGECPDRWSSANR
jgi:hypothetical protein